MCVAFALLPFGGACALAARVQRYAAPDGPAALGGCVWRTDALVLDALSPAADPAARRALAHAPTPFAPYLRYAAECAAPAPDPVRARAAVAALVDGGARDGAPSLLPLGELLVALLHHRTGAPARAGALAAEALAAAREWQAPACVAQAAWLAALLAARAGTSPLRTAALERAARAATVHAKATAAVPSSPSSSTSSSASSSSEWAPSFEGVNCALQLALVHAATASAGTATTAKEGARMGPRERAQRCVDAARAAALALPEPARTHAVARTGYVEATLHAAWGLAPLAAHVRTPLQHAVFLAAAGRHADALHLLRDAPDGPPDGPLARTHAALAAAVALSRALQTGDARRARELVHACCGPLAPADVAYWLPRIAARAPHAAVRGLRACAAAAASPAQPDAHALAAAAHALLAAAAAHEPTGRTLRAARTHALCRAHALAPGALAATVALAEGLLRAGAARLALALLDTVCSSAHPSSGSSSGAVPAPVAAAAHVACARAHMVCAHAARLPAVRTALLQRAAAETAAACAQCRAVDDVPGLAAAAHVLALLCHALRWPHRRNAAAAEWLRCQHRLAAML